MQQDDRIDPSYGSDPEYGLFGYKIDANTHMIDFGVNYSLNRVSALDLSFQWINVKGEFENNYKNYVLNLGYLYRFR